MDRDIWDSGRRGSGVSSDLLHGGLKSHILIAACSSSELATEADGRGNFSTAFLKLLRSTSPDEIRYSDILTYMDTIPRYALYFSRQIMEADFVAIPVKIPNVKEQIRKDTYSIPEFPCIIGQLSRSHWKKVNSSWTLV